MTNITFVAFVENLIALPQVSVLGVFLSSSKIYLNRAILDRKSKSSKEKRLVSKSSSSSMINDSESILFFLFFWRIEICSSGGDSHGKSTSDPKVMCQDDVLSLIKSALASFNKEFNSTMQESFNFIEFFVEQKIDDSLSKFMASQDVLNLPSTGNPLHAPV